MTILVHLGSPVLKVLFMSGADGYVPEPGARENTKVTWKVKRAFVGVQPSFFRAYWETRSSGCTVRDLGNF
jgi:hypothetical protein